MRHDYKYLQKVIIRSSPYVVYNNKRTIRLQSERVLVYNYKNQIYDMDFTPLTCCIATIYTILFDHTIA